MSLLHSISKAVKAQLGSQLRILTIAKLKVSLLEAAKLKRFSLTSSNAAFTAGCCRTASSLSNAVGKSGMHAANEVEMNRAVSAIDFKNANILSQHARSCPVRWSFQTEHMYDMFWWNLTSPSFYRRPITQHSYGYSYCQEPSRGCVTHRVTKAFQRYLTHVPANFTLYAG